MAKMKTIALFFGKKEILQMFVLICLMIFFATGLLHAQKTPLLPPGYNGNHPQFTPGSILIKSPNQTTVCQGTNVSATMTPTDTAFIATQWKPSTTLPNLPAKTKCPASAWLGDTLYVHAPNSSGTASKIMYQYTWNGVWRTGKQCITAVSGAPLVACNGKLYLVGGGTTNNTTAPSANMQQYNPATGVWTARASLPVALLGHGAVNWGDSVIFVIGGSVTAGTINNNIYYYRVASNTWGTIVNSLPANQSRKTFAISIVNRNQIIISGGTISTITNTTFVGTIGANASLITWQQKANAPSAVSRCGGTAFKNFFFLTGGDLSGTAIPYTHVYDVNSDTWFDTIPGNPHPVSYLNTAITCKLINDSLRIFQPGGYTNASLAFQSFDVTGGNIGFITSESDILERRTKTGNTWDAWIGYNSGMTVSTTGKTGVEIRTWLNDVPNPDTTTVNWIVESQARAGQLQWTPETRTVCEGANVSATLTSGSGGSGTDIIQYRSRTGVSWGNWITYNAGDPISTSTKSSVEIRTWRVGPSCGNSDTLVMNWLVENPAVAGTLTKSIDAASVCEGTNVFATFSPGSGGSLNHNATIAKQWMPSGSLPDLPLPTQFAAAAWLGDTLYVHTPGKNGTVSTTMLKYTWNGTWHTGVPCLTAVTCASLTVCKGRLYLIGGNTSSGESAIVQEYNPASGAWTAKTSMPQALSGHSSVCWGDSVIIVAGGPWDNSILNRNVYYFRPALNTWGTISNSLPPNLGRRTFAMGITYRDQILISCGYDTRSRDTTLIGTLGKSAAEITWTMKSEAPSVLSRCGGAAFQNYFFVVGGDRFGIDNPDAYIYNASTDTWTDSIENMPHPASNIYNSVTSKLINDTLRIFKPGGFNLNSPCYQAFDVTGGPDVIQVSPSDILEFRTKDLVGWSSWEQYLSGDTIPTIGKTDVEIRTWRDAEFCENSDTVLIKWTVSSPTVGGSVTGGTEVCYGSNNTVLTLSGHTGSILKWEESADGISWDSIAGATSTTYTAIDLTADTYFRAVVQSSGCDVKNSDSTQITVFSNYQISGYAKYENNPKTPLNGLKIILRQGNNAIDSVLTTTNGFYQFSGLTNGTYGLQIKSAHSSGLWQTWNGVNNTDYMLVLRHATSGPPLSTTPPVTRISANVKAPLTTAIDVTDANAIRMAGKYGWGNPSWFDIPKWVFSGPNAGSRIDSIVLSCGNLTREIRGLCAGDVNGSYLPPNGYKMAEPNLELMHQGELPIADEITFPIRAERDMEMGAITLMLDFDPAMIEITGVEMPENGGVEPWFEVQSSRFQVAGTLNLEPETLNILQIGWASLNPINVVEGQIVLMIHARLTNEFQISNFKSDIRFSLNDNPNSELANNEGNVIENAKLSIPDAKFKMQTVNGKMQNEGLVNVYPNPAKDVLNIEFVIGNVDARTCHVTPLQLFTMQGIVVTTQNIPDFKPGLNKTTLDLRNLPNGAYMLKVAIGEQIEVRKVMVSR